MALSPIEQSLRALKIRKCHTFIGHPVFYDTNEYGVQQTLESILDKPVRGNTLLGVSGLYNLDLLAQRLTQHESKENLQHLVILDVNPHVIDFWNKTLQILAKNDDRNAFVLELQTCVANEEQHFIRALYLRSHGFLTSDSNYSAVRLGICSARCTSRVQERPV